MTHYMHHVPGRLRIRNHLFRGNGPLLGEVRRCFRDAEGISEIKVSPVTGSVLIKYNPDRIASDKILEILQDCEYIDLSRAQTLDAKISASVYKASTFIGRHCLGTLVGHSLKPSGLSFLSALL